MDPIEHHIKRHAPVHPPDHVRARVLQAADAMASPRPARGMRLYTALQASAAVLAITFGWATWHESRVDARLAAIADSASTRSVDQMVVQTRQSDEGSSTAEERMYIAALKALPKEKPVPPSAVVFAQNPEMARAAFEAIAL